MISPNKTMTTMDIRVIFKYFGVAFIAVMFTACTVPSALTIHNTENKTTPEAFPKTTPQDSVNTGKIQWREFFRDPYLAALIDSALRNNQELNITLREITIAQNEIRARKGEYLPFLGAGAEGGFEKPGKYTPIGALEENVNVREGEKFPDPLPNYMIGLNASWEVDIWKKLRNARKSAVHRYLSSVEGKNFMVTNLIAEIATSYYELMALDNQLDILRQNIEIQTNALEIVKLQKLAARVTELGVRRFEAEVLKNQSRIFYIQQNIVELENHINFLVGRFPQAVPRNSQNFASLVPDSIHAGLPSQLLMNRPDIRQAEQDLMASKIDVQVAKAQFYPSLRISGALGYQAFNPKYLIQPESMMYTVAGELMAPLVNRNALKAFYYSANARQIQSVYNYERSILNAYIEVANQVSNISNLKRSYDLKQQQVQALVESITISTTLFRSARADYMEVLLTQRDALEARFELIETKMQQMNAMVNIYQALGGGWN
jgi:NodT family efflux transporter outer membrane factor (OMF) lipoprotein